LDDGETVNMPGIHFDFEGVRVRVESDSAAAVESLRRDFSRFVAPASGDAMVWRLQSRRADVRRATKSGRPWTAWSAGAVRHVAYDDGAYGFRDADRGYGELFSDEPVRLQEIAHLAILSAVGEELDSRGLHRVHALGFTYDDGAGLILLPSGGGKSELALELLARGDFGLLSEDTPLIDASATVSPFPVRLSFRAGADLGLIPPERVRAYRRRRYGERRLVDADYFESRLAGPAPLRWIFIGEKSERDGGPQLRPANKAAASAALIEALVVGVGVPQMAEWRLRPEFSCAAGLLQAGASRLHAAFVALAAAETERFRLAPAATASADALERWLKSRAR
jgi:hypothetical protein